MIVKPQRWGRDTAELDEDVIDDTTISTVPVAIGTGHRLFGGQLDLENTRLGS